MVLPNPYRRATSGSMLFTVIIPNYNYEAYVGRAIESALALDWPHVEVIVVDDGSTDQSPEVIRRYDKKIKAFFQPHADQRAACNEGFAQSKGEIVLFLDSDDEMDPSLAREVMKVWRPGISKVQVQMTLIDANGKELGSVLPNYGGTPTPEDVRKWLQSTGAYPCPPGSGNVYAREFLDKIFPLEGTEPAYDSYCLAAAPLLGDVVTIRKPLVRYRIHGRNDGAMATLDVERLRRELARGRRRFEYTQTIAQRIGIRLPESVFMNGLMIAAFRLASVRLDAQGHPVAGDSRRSALFNLLRASAKPQGVPIAMLATLIMWGTLVALGPRDVAASLVAWRYVPAARPTVVRRVAKRLGVVASAARTRR